MNPFFKNHLTHSYPIWRENYTLHTICVLSGTRIKIISTT